MELPVQKSPLPVMGHNAVAIGNTILVWGGYTTAQHIHDGVMLQMEPYIDPKLLWFYQPEYDHWHPTYTDGDIPRRTSGSGMVVINHYLYVFGGYTNMGNSNQLYRLDLNTLVWELLDNADMKHPSPRDKFMYWVHEEKFYIFGGFGVPTCDFLSEHGSFVCDDSIQNVRGWNNQLFVYDTKLGLWSNPKCKGSVPSPRAAGATVCIRNMVYLFGGRHCDRRLNDLYVLDIHAIEWTRLITSGLSPPGRSWHTFTAISPSHIVLYGGYSQQRITLNDIWMLDVSSLEWTTFRSTKHILPRLWHTASFTEEQDLVIFGGCSNDILSSETLAKSHNEVFVFRFTPHTLFRLSLNVVHHHRALLESEFPSLPETVQQHLSRRQDICSEKDLDEELGNARTCSIS
ncbi:hypothetical protein LSH36_334g00012 [Paralvinella palmiformis]|uniref:Kelch domain-containing protein 2 n=1 Tax=Paralvinella palmiformis TaxID=53620 RepID=A0AAD9JGI2_9ANNE|nr:hypothetical protein LSH36_334g00012 [Paralvinella palmiformis]